MHPASLKFTVNLAFASAGRGIGGCGWCIEQTLSGPDGRTANVVLDDGGDATKSLRDEHSDLLAGIRGISEETTTSVNRLYEAMRKGELQGPRDQRQPQPRLLAGGAPEVLHSPGRFCPGHGTVVRAISGRRAPLVVRRTQPIRRVRSLTERDGRRI